MNQRQIAESYEFLLSGTTVNGGKNKNLAWRLYSCNWPIEVNRAKKETGVFVRFADIILKKKTVFENKNPT
jgi:hypothetical protein